MRYHLHSKASHWHGDTLQLLWCVVDKDGNQLTRWLSHHGAEVELGKLLGAQRRACA